MDTRQLLLHYAAGERNFTKSQLYRAELQNTNLERAVLKYANLEQANLQNTNLKGADLTFANLMGANLSCANLQNADLFGANLMGANLVNANLENAELYSAKLEKAKLCVVNLKRVNLRKTEPNVNLNGCLLAIAFCLFILFAVSSGIIPIPGIIVLLLFTSIPIAVGIEVGSTATSLLKAFQQGLCRGCIFGLVYSYVLFIIFSGGEFDLTNASALILFEEIHVFCVTLSLLTALSIYGLRLL